MSITSFASSKYRGGNMTLLVERMMSDELERLRSETDVWAAGALPSTGDVDSPADLRLGAHPNKAADDYVADASDNTICKFRALIDLEKVRHAQQFFATFGLQIGAALVCKSLPDSYAAARGAQVLYLSGELVLDPARRVRETTQFVLTLMTPLPASADNPRAPTTLDPGQPGAIAARSIRVFHQNVRNFITDQCQERWSRRQDYFEKDVAPGGPKLGAPLNQEDLIGTLHEFTVGVFECLDLLGVPYSHDDKAAWFHVWDVVGCHMGIGTKSALGTAANDIEIDPLCTHFLRLDPKLSEATLAVIRRRHHMKSVEGTILTNALLAEFQRPLQRSMKPFPAALTRYLLGDETANLLEISRGGWLQQFLLSMNSVPRIAAIVGHRRKGAFVRVTTSELSAMATQQLLQSYVQEGRGPGRGFEVPSHLQNAWGLLPARV